MTPCCGFTTNYVAPNRVTAKPEAKKSLPRSEVWGVVGGSAPSKSEGNREDSLGRYRRGKEEKNLAGQLRTQLSL